MFRYFNIDNYVNRYSQMFVTHRETTRDVTSHTISILRYSFEGSFAIARYICFLPVQRLTTPFVVPYADNNEARFA